MDQTNNQAVLQGVSLKLTPGKVLALTGASGEGKSTLATLITRLYEPRQGSVTLDGVDIAELNPSWLRRQVSIRVGSGLLSWLCELVHDTFVEGITRRVV